MAPIAHAIRSTSGLNGGGSKRWAQGVQWPPRSSRALSLCRTFVAQYTAARIWRRHFNLAVSSMGCQWRCRGTPHQDHSDSAM